MDLHVLGTGKRENIDREVPVQNEEYFNSTVLRADGNYNPAEFEAFYEQLNGVVLISIPIWAQISGKIWF